LSLFSLKFANFIIANNSFFVPSSFHGIFLTEARFPPEGRWFSRNSGCQDVAVPPQNTGVGVRCVSLLFSLHFSWAFLVGYVPLLALVYLPLQSTIVVLVIHTATYPTTSHRRFALRALSFVSFWPTLSLHYNILATQKRGE
jgi:hypothetical protein